MGMFLSRLEPCQEGQKEWTSALLVAHRVGASVKPLTDGVKDRFSDAARDIMSKQ